jgi:hypothetical protein
MATTKTIKAAGGDYTSLYAWEDAIEADLTGTGVAEAVCYSLDDTTALSVIGWTTTAADYISIHTDPSAYHGGIWNGDKYNLVVTNGPAFTINEDYVRIDGIQAQVSAVDGNSDDVIVYGTVAIGANNAAYVSRCILRGATNGSYSQTAIKAADSDCKTFVWNTIMYGFGATAASGNRVVAAATMSIYNCVGIGGYYGLYASGGVVTAKNNYFGVSASEDYYRAAGGTLNKINCASEDASADDTSGADETQSNCIISVAHSTSTFVNVTAGTENYHLVVGSSLIGAGVDTSGDAAPMNFTTDIDGDTRS